jgi:hypothetical protein
MIFQGWKLLRLGRRISDQGEGLAGLVYIQAQERRAA